MKDKMPIIMIQGPITISADPKFLHAVFPVSPWPFSPLEIKTKSYDHIDDLHALPLKGLITLAKEFYNEILQSIK